MNLSKNDKILLKRINGLQLNAIEYYKACAETSSDDYLIELFNALTDQHRLSSKMLETYTALNPNYRRKKFLEIIENRWRQVRIIILLNDRERISKFCIRTEKRIKNSIDDLLESANVIGELEEDLYFVEFKNNLLLQKINSLPTQLVSSRQAA